MKILSSIWIALFVFTSIVSIFFISKAAVGIFAYMKFSKAVPAEIYQWEILEEKNEAFFLKAYFRYKVFDQTYKGESTLYQKKFLNMKAAELIMRDWAKESWLAWFNPHKISEVTLEKAFPFNFLFRGMLSIGVLGYLVFARKKIKKYLS